MQLSRRKVIEEVKENVENIKKQLPKDVLLIAVSKRQPTDRILAAIKAGQVDFGENRIQELFQKQQTFFNHPLRWHFIGQLQRNKVKSLLGVPKLQSIQSIDSRKLLNELITNESLCKDRCIELYLQMNTSGESEKTGFISEDEIVNIINKLLQEKWSWDSGMLLSPKKGLAIKGLMTMGKIRTENFEDDARSCFNRLMNI
ncbi:alanine racemase, partial [Bacteriovoracaceae bacterium]|nr:alanine racemase [Bacteriovoracaceae bacterium]